MRPLTKETIEMTRQGLLSSDWCGFSKRDTVNQLCDLALKAITAPSEKQTSKCERCAVLEAELAEAIRDGAEKSQAYLRRAQAAEARLK